MWWPLKNRPWRKNFQKKVCECSYLTSLSSADINLNEPYCTSDRHIDATSPKANRRKWSRHQCVTTSIDQTWDRVKNWEAEVTRIEDDVSPTSTSHHHAQLRGLPGSSLNPSRRFTRLSWNRWRGRDYSRRSWELQPGVSVQQLYLGRWRCLHGGPHAA